MTLRPEIGDNLRVRLPGRLDPFRPDPVRPGLEATVGHVRIVRPRDLLAFDASWSGMTLERDAPAEGERPHLPRLVAGPQGGLLTCVFSFQHVAEGATEPDFVGDENLDFTVPLPARAARPSRLVFKVPAGSTIGYSTAGLLAAMSRLEPAVAPAAIPAAKPVPWWLGDIGTVTSTTRLLATADRGRISRVEVDIGERRLTATDLIESQRGLVASNRLIARGILTTTGPFRPRRPPVTTPAVPELHTPRADETAIEAPFRLILSPSSLAGWAHAQAPVAAHDDRGRVELWHSRLAVRGADGIDEGDTSQRIVRAIWHRDRDRDVAGSSPPSSAATPARFPTSTGTASPARSSASAASRRRANGHGPGWSRSPTISARRPPASLRNGG